MSDRLDTLAPSAPVAPVAPAAPRPALARLVLRGSAIVVGVTLAQKLLGLLLFRALALHYGPATFGDWNTAFAFLSFFGILTDAGIDTIVVREAARQRPDLPRFLGTAILARLALAGVAYALCVGIVLLMPYQHDLQVLILLAALPMFFSFNNVYADVLQAQMKIGYIKAVGLTVTALTTLGGFLVIGLNGNLQALALVNLLAALPAVVLYQRLAGRIGRAAFTLDPALFQSLIREALPLALSGVFGVIYYRIDTVLLSLFQASDSVGYYAATYKLTEVLNVLPGAVMIPVFPLLARYAGDPAARDLLLRLYHTAFKYLALLILPLASGVAVLADQIVLFLYAPEYLPAATAMRLIIWAEIPMFLSPVVYQLAIAHGRQRLLLRAAAVMAAFNILANLALIPWLNYNGAALATTLTELIGLGLGLVFVARTLGIGLPPGLGPVLVSLVPYGLCLALVPATGQPGWAVLAGLIYLAALHLTGGLRLPELRSFLTGEC